jgi:hypothetical protein
MKDDAENRKTAHDCREKNRFLPGGILSLRCILSYRKGARGEIYHASFSIGAMTLFFSSSYALGTRFGAKQMSKQFMSVAFNCKRTIAIESINEQKYEQFYFREVY